MNDLRKKLEKARTWLTSAVPTSTGGAKNNPLYVILSDIIDSVEKLEQRDAVEPHTTVELLPEATDLTWKDTKSVQVRTEENCVSREEADQYITELKKARDMVEEQKAKLDELAAQLDELNTQVEKSFAELVKMVLEE